MYQLRAAAAGARSEVFGLDQRGAQAASGRVKRSARAGRTTWADGAQSARRGRPGRTARANGPHAPPMTSTSKPPRRSAASCALRGAGCTAASSQGCCTRCWLASANAGRGAHHALMTAAAPPPEASNASRRLAILPTGARARPAEARHAGPAGRAPTAHTRVARTERAQQARTGSARPSRVWSYVARQNALFEPRSLRRHGFLHRQAQDREGGWQGARARAPRASPAP